MVNGGGREPVEEIRRYNGSGSGKEREKTAFVRPFQAKKGGDTMR